MREEGTTPQKREIWPIVERIIRPAAAALVAGLVAGAVAAGGSRIAMRIAAATSDTCAGVVTENGNNCGEFTLGGTAGLVFFGTVFTGVPGGILYAAFSTWLRPLGRWRGLSFGALALVAAGFTVLDAGNVDFERFGPPLVNVVTFGALFVLFGLFAAPAFDAVERRLPGLPPGPPFRPARLIGYGLMALTVFVTVLIAVASFGLGLAVLAALGAIHELGRRVTDRPRPQALGFAYLIPIALVIGGGFLTVRSITDILG